LTSSALNGYLYLGEYDKFVSSLPVGSDSALILFYRAFGEYHLKKFGDATRHFEAAFEQRPSMLQARIGKALSEGIAERKEKGVELLRETETKIAARGVGDPEAMYKIAQAYATLGERKAALGALRASIDGGFFSYPYLITDPLIENLRGESEFKPLLASAKQRHDAFRRMFF